MSGKIKKGGHCKCEFIKQSQQNSIDTVHLARSRPEFLASATRNLADPRFASYLPRVQRHPRAVSQNATDLV